MMKTRHLLLVSVVALAACSPAPQGPGSDAGPADGGEQDADRPAPEGPEAPASPRLAPCPEGWGEVPSTDGSEVLVCEPWPSSGRESCGEAEAHFPGRHGCEAVGSPCSEDGWPSDLPGSSVLFVRHGAEAGGDGSRDRPFTSIGEALAAATEGSTVAVARGIYDEAVALDGGLSLVGACAAETAIAGAEDAPTVTVSGQGNGIRDLTLTGATGAGLRVSGEVALDGVVIRDTFDTGLEVRATGSVTGHDVVIRGVRAPSPCPSAGCSTAGIRGFGGSVDLERAVVADIPALGLMAVGTRVHLADAAIVAAGTREHGRSSAGVLAGGGALVEAERVVIEDSFTAAVMAVGATVTLTSAVVRGTEAISDGTGWGLGASGAGSVTATRSLVDDTVTYGVVADGAGTAVTLEDVVVARAGFVGADFTGIGVATVEGASASICRAVIEGCAFAGLAVNGEGSSLEAEDVTLRDNAGPGAYVFESAAATIGRAVVEESGIVGVVVESGATADLEDLTVRATRTLSVGDEVHGTYGRGVDAIGGARVTMRRALLDGNHEVSLYAAAEGSLEGSDVTILGTLPRECGAPCEGRELGVGVCAILDARVALERFEVSHNAVCGILIATGAEVDLRSGLVSDNPIGVNVQVEGYDLDRLMDDVTYEDNDLRLDSTFGLVPPTPELPFEP